jgi:ribosomal protein L4
MLLRETASARESDQEWYVCVCVGGGGAAHTESQRYWQSSSQRREYIMGLSSAVVAGINGSVRHLACGKAVTSHLLAVGAEFHLSKKKEKTKKKKKARTKIRKKKSSNLQSVALAV